MRYASRARGRAGRRTSAEVKAVSWLARRRPAAHASLLTRRGAASRCRRRAPVLAWGRAWRHGGGIRARLSRRACRPPAADARPRPARRRARRSARRTAATREHGRTAPPTPPCRCFVPPTPRPSTWCPQHSPPGERRAFGPPLCLGHSRVAVCSGEPPLVAARLASASANASASTPARSASPLPPASCVAPVLGVACVDARSLVARRHSWRPCAGPGARATRRGARRAAGCACERCPPRSRASALCLRFTLLVCSPVARRPGRLASHARRAARTRSRWRRTTRPSRPAAATRARRWARSCRPRPRSLPLACARRALRPRSQPRRDAC